LSTEPDPRLVALSNLLLVEHDVRRAESLRELFFIAANDSHRVAPYRQGFVWERAVDGTGHPVQASNVSDLEPNAPMVLWLRELCAWLATRDDKTPVVVAGADAPEGLRAGWAEFASPFGVHVPVLAPDGTRLGGLLLATDTAWSPAQCALLERLADAYGHAWWALRPRVVQDVRAHFRAYWRRYAAATVILLLLPVRQFVLVPAEVVPADPFVVAAPMSGVVARIDVLPNAAVEAGTPLFRLEETDLANELVVAEKAYEVAEAEYLKNAQDAFGCDDCRGRVPELLAQREKAAAQVEWARQQLERSRIAAPVAGIAVFSDPNEWRGRPVAVGERVMMLASPEATRLRITLPIADAISIESGTEVVFYLNVNPLDSYDANIAQTSYEATVQPDQSLAYVLLADFSGEPARLGMRGTAKVYGARAPILFHVLRRPLAWLRQTLGV
jgi:hypothetical protein